MKRKRNSTQEGNYLPRPIIDDILLKLSVKSILICKCVCKSWRTVISDPQFAKLLSAKAEPCALLQASDSTTLHLVEPQECHNFDLGYCICDDDRGFRCDRHTKLAHMGHYPSGVKRKSDIRVPPKDRNFKVVNSCNGFLCLSEPSSNEPVVVCNPITGEYINLPVGKGRPSKKTQYFVDCGLGFSPRTNKYKVIRMFERQFADRARVGARMSCCTPETGWINYSSGIEICTLGEGSWKRIRDAPFLYCNLTFPTYLEGCVHWLLYEEFRGFRGRERTLNIVCFSFDKEQFKLYSSPREYQKCYANYILDLGIVHNVSMGVLNGCLCICDANYDPIYIWVMKKYGVGKSWTKMFSIHTDQSWPKGLYQPINYLKNGGVLLFHYDKCALICYDPEIPKFKYLKIRGAESKFKAIAYVPSFVSLKEAIVGDNVVVLNMSSRCAKFKGVGETKALSLVEEDRGYGI